MSSATHPTVFHATHWKAGSQWIRAVLKAARPRRCFGPKVDMRDALREPIVPGAIYSPVYLSKPALDRVIASHEGPTRVFCVMRDLRDTLVSWYYSLVHSHPTDGSDFVARERARLREMGEEKGLIHLADSEGMRSMIETQRSWLDSDAPIYLYEELVERPHDVFERIFEQCELGIDPERRREIVERFSFERLTGRPRGSEDVTQYLRKGVVGDWRRFQSPALLERFARLAPESTACAVRSRS